MSLAACIPGLVDDGTITADRGRRILKLYDELLTGFKAQMGGPAAEAAATEKALAQMVGEQRLAKQRAVLTVDTQRRMAADMATFKGAKKDGPIAPRAAAAVLVRDDRAPYLNLEYLWKGVRARAHSRMDQILEKHRAGLLGQIRDKEGLDAIVDAMHGDKVADLNAREVADAATQALEELRVRANAAGADIGKLENHGLPHNHSGEKVGDAGFVEWRDFIVPLLDRERLIDRATGSPMDDDVLTAVLEDTFKAIDSDGWSRREPGGTGRSSLANRLGEHRFLHFKDGAAWRTYNERFGTGSAYDALMGHIDRMARDIALMETLGPNPAAGLKWLQDSVVKSAAESGSRADRAAAGKAASKLQNLYDEATGKLRMPEGRRVALAFSHVRNWQAAAKLGSATLSTTSDVATTALTKGFNGLPQTDTLAQYLKHLNPASAEDRAHALRLGLIADEYGQRASTSARLLGEEMIGELPKRVSDGVLKLSGLQAVTSAGQFGFGKSMVAGLTLFRTQAFDDLNPAFRRMLTRYGFDAAQWDAIRATPLTDDMGAKWLEPLNIADRKLGDRVMAMIHTETDFAVPTIGLELSAGINSSLKRGTLLGELGRTAFQFKAFPVTVTMMHSQRMWASGGWQGRAGYLASMLILATMAGAAAMQMKEIAKGKNPRPMDDWSFWGAAAAQGGGAGIYGDFIRGSQSRFGQRFTDTLFGPAWASADTLSALTLDAAGDAIRGEKVGYGARLSRALRSEMPGGSLWFGRAAFERLIVDQLQSQIDPSYRQSWKRIERRAGETGQDYFWRPGQPLPDRAPDITNAFGGDAAPP